MPTHVPAKSSSPVAVDVGELGGLAAQEHAACGSADLGRALDELGDLLQVDRAGGDVVEQEERLGSCREDVVDAVCGEVGAAGLQLPARTREDQLRADAVGGGGEDAPVVEPAEPRERAEARRPVDSTAARRRSTTASPFAIETPADSYVRASATARESSGEARRPPYTRLVAQLALPLVAAVMYGLRARTLRRRGTPVAGLAHRLRSPARWSSSLSRSHRPWTTAPTSSSAST